MRANMIAFAAANRDLDWSVHSLSSKEDDLGNCIQLGEQLTELATSELQKENHRDKPVLTRPNFPV